MNLNVVTNCEGCGACCRHMGGTPSILAVRPGNDSLDLGPVLPASLNAELIALIDGWIANDDWPGDVPCIWLDEKTGKCRNYEFRPDVCREFEVGSVECLQHRSRLGIGEVSR